MMNRQTEEKQNIVIFHLKGSKLSLNVTVKGETVWLTQAQIASLFGTKRPAITKHLRNIFKNKELNQKSVCSILEHTAADKRNIKSNNKALVVNLINKLN